MNNSSQHILDPADAGSVARLRAVAEEIATSLSQTHLQLVSNHGWVVLVKIGTRLKVCMDRAGGQMSCGDSLGRWPRQTQAGRHVEGL